MKILKSALLTVGCLVLLTPAGCSRAAGDSNIGYSGSDFNACKQVMQSACNAFNAYDAEKFMTFLTPEYALEAAVSIRDQISQFTAGRGMGVKMTLVDIQEPVVKPNGSLEIRFILRIIPIRLHPDENKVTLLQKTDKGWRIAAISDLKTEDSTD
jgi:hypothetical protein